MAIKVFCDVPVVYGYVNNPADGFRMTIGLKIFEEEGGEDNGPMLIDDMADITVPLESTPLDVYQALYSQIVAKCTAYLIDIPTKADIFGYAPASMATLLPDLPLVS